MADQIIARETLSITHTNVTEADKELGAYFNRTVWKSLQWANLWLDFGPDTHRLAAAKELWKAAAKLSALESKDDVALARESLLHLVTSMSQLPPGVIEEAEVVE